jgi:hypothetical protein
MALNLWGFELTPILIVPCGRFSQADLSTHIVVLNFPRLNWTKLSFHEISPNLAVPCTKHERTLTGIVSRFFGHVSLGDYMPVIPMILIDM